MLYPNIYQIIPENGAPYWSRTNLRGFADPCLAAWLTTHEFGIPKGIRTPTPSVKGMYANHYIMGTKIGRSGG